MQLTIKSAIVENNKDVIILSILIREQLKLRDGRKFNLNQLYQNETLKKIANNFERIEIKNHKGYISAYFKFANARNNSRIELNDNERATWLLNKLTEKNMARQYDSEI